MNLDTKECTGLFFCRTPELSVVSRGRFCRRSSGAPEDFAPVPEQANRNPTKDASLPKAEATRWSDKRKE